MKILAITDGADIRGVRQPSRALLLGSRTAAVLLLALRIACVPFSEGSTVVAGAPFLAAADVVLQGPGDKEVAYLDFRTGAENKTYRPEMIRRIRAQDCLSQVGVRGVLQPLPQSLELKDDAVEVWWDGSHITRVIKNAEATLLPEEKLSGFVFDISTTPIFRIWRRVCLKMDAAVLKVSGDSKDAFARFGKDLASGVRVTVGNLISAPGRLVMRASWSSDLNLQAKAFVVSAERALFARKQREL